MPALGGVYKLSAIYHKDGTITPKIKVSETSAKITNPGFKNIYRVYDNATGKAEADVIYLRDESDVDTSKPLKITHPYDRWKTITFENYTLRSLHVDVIKNGKLVYKLPTLMEIKEYAKKELESFWDEYKRLDNPHVYKVDLSDKLFELKSKLLKEVREK